MKQLVIIVQCRILVLHMIRVFKDKRSAGANGLLGEGGQDPRSEERELREGEGEKGRERTSAMRNRQDENGR